MKQTKAEQFAAFLLSQGLVYAPQKTDGSCSVKKIIELKQIDWSGDMPDNSFKSVLLPPKEILQEVKAGQIKVKFAAPKVFCFLMNVLDLQAATLLEHIFEKDIYFQARRQNLFLIGFSTGVPGDVKKYDAFHSNYEENILEHILFDVFIEKTDRDYKFFSGSEKGQQLLAGAGINNYQNVEFAGLVPESGLNPRLLENKKNVELSENSKLWDELAQICLACGKCSIVCPTCYCHDLRDEVNDDGVSRVREWTSCFYSEFSKTAGNKIDLDTLRKKLFYWYFHKFVRIPDKLSYYGCVSCMRCVKACPVGINISANLQRLQKENNGK